jgi:NADH-quinone oxidoreductase chain I
MSEVKEAAAESPQLTVDQERLNQARKPGFGLGLLKGMAVTLKHLFKHNTVIQYPDEKQDLSPRTRGVIALKEENCTVCMLCARECPDWCIYIDSHKETLPPKREGGRQRKRNVLDRFAIDYALCMYCGICVEVCPYDALFWSREFEYAEYDIRELTHEKERLSDWMATVLPPPPLEVGAEMPGAPTAPAAQTTTPATGARPATETSSAAAARPAQAAAAPAEGTAAPTAARPKDSEPGVDAERGERAEARSSSAEQVRQEASAPTAPPATTPTEERTGTATPQLAEDVKAEQMSPEATTTAEPEKPAAERPAETEAHPGDSGAVDTAPAAPAPPNVEVPREEPHPVALHPVDDPEAVYKQVLAEQLDKGSSPQVAEARAKVARVKAERGIPRGPSPVEVAKPVPSAPTKAEIASQHQEAASPGQLAGEPTPSGAPRAEEPEPEQGPVAAEPAEAAGAPEARAETTETVGESAAPTTSEDPEAVYERVLREERAKGSSDAVATARAKAARVRALKGTKGPT